MYTARKASLRVFILTLVVFITSCSQPLNKREKGVLVGGGLGAATGAIIGAAVGAPGAGAAIGGAVGALGGGIIGDQLQGVENRQNAQQAQIDQQQREIRRQKAEISNLKRKAKKPAYEDE
jgi:outer membrane lipoprotein SlyB